MKELLHQEAVEQSTVFNKTKEMLLRAIIKE